MERRDLRTLTLVLSAMVAIDALAVPVILLAALAFPEAYAANVMPIANQVDIGTIIFNVATIIVFCRWIYVAGKNLDGTDYTHADASQEMDFMGRLQARADSGDIPPSLVQKVLYDNPKTFYAL